jgi:hypothetical protein
MTHAALVNLKVPHALSDYPTPDVEGPRKHSRLTKHIEQAGNGLYPKRPWRYLLIFFSCFVTLLLI